VESICTPTQCTSVSSIIPATITHVQMVNHQQNLPAFEKSISYKANRVGIADRFEGDSLLRITKIDLWHQTLGNFTADHLMGDLTTQASPAGSLLNRVVAHAI